MHLKKEGWPKRLLNVETGTFNIFNVKIVKMFVTADFKRFFYLHNKYFNYCSTLC